MMPRSLRVAALRVPLAAKLIGANLGVLLVVLAALVIWGGAEATPGRVALLGIVLTALHGALVALALRPIHDLELVAARLARGDFGARVGPSEVADHDVLHLGATLNHLLDDLSRDRSRLRALASEVIAAGDRERAAIAHELHDSTAQQLAALMLELSMLARVTRDGDVAGRLLTARDHTQAILEEVRLLSHTVHPAELDDLGLGAALRKLARDASAGTGVDVDVAVEPGEMRLERSAERVLYRVAQESVRNAIRHGAPHRVQVRVVRWGGQARLEVHDDGVGFDLAAVEREGRSRGLAQMRERVGLVDGVFEVRAARGGGASIIATVPVGAGTRTVQ